MVDAVATVQGLVKSYALGTQQIEVLTGLDLTLWPGEICGVMGPSGAGKSTLLNCLAGIDRPDQGQIRLLGQAVDQESDDARTLLRRRHVGIIYQFFNLVPNLDVTENVMLPYLIDGVPADLPAIQHALSRVGMGHRHDHLPSQLSGGEMQLVSIARAIVRKPAVILADEPTGNVNVATGRKIMALLREVVKECQSALLLVTHNPEDAAKADRVVFLKDGRLDEAQALKGEEVSVAAIHTKLEQLGI
ncbi:MAG: ABC transporter ATP-binding protein [Deltaproteobacteria bacterium]|nr:ABC transporter ATP-binding protein [Deltaproteobacteria bacterium]